MSIQKRQLVKKKEHRLNKICHFCKKKALKMKISGKIFVKKKAPKQKVKKTVKKKAGCQKKRHQKKGTLCVYNFILYYSL